METFTNEAMRSLLASSLTTAALDKGVWKDSGEGAGSTEGEFLSWLTIKDQTESVRADVHRLRNHPLVFRGIRFTVISTMLRPVAQTKWPRLLRLAQQ
jgi:carbonic anhydrase